MIFFQIFSPYEISIFCQIAAQNCRKRKLEQICLLETDLSDARTRKEELVGVKIVRKKTKITKNMKKWQMLYHTRKYKATKKKY